MSNLVKLPNNGFAPSNSIIADHLREQADWLEESDSLQFTNVVIVMECVDGTIHRQACGLPLDRARLIGLLTMAAMDASSGNSNTEE